jgi:hypothetical protein
MASPFSSSTSSRARLVLFALFGLSTTSAHAEEGAQAAAPGSEQEAGTAPPAAVLEEEGAVLEPQQAAPAASQP